MATLAGRTAPPQDTLAKHATTAHWQKKQKQGKSQGNEDKKEETKEERKKKRKTGTITRKHFMTG